jgi:hypothetical protein
MNRIRDNLRMTLARPWAVWALFAVGVGVYVSLVLAESYSGRLARHGWSVLCGAIIPFVGFGLSWRGHNEITTNESECHTYTFHNRVLPGRTVCGAHPTGWGPAHAPGHAAVVSGEQGRYLDGNWVNQGKVFIMHHLPT